MMVLLFTFSARILCYFNMRPPQKKWVNGEFPCYTPHIWQGWKYHHFGTIFLPLKLHQIHVIRRVRWITDETWESPSMIKVNVFWKPCSKPYGSFMFIIYKRLIHKPSNSLGELLFFNLQHSCNLLHPNIYRKSQHPRKSPRPPPTEKNNAPGQCVRIFRKRIGIRRTRSRCGAGDLGANGFFSPQMVGEGSGKCCPVQLLANEMFRCRNCW